MSVRYLAVTYVTL